MIVRVLDTDLAQQPQTRAGRVPGKRREVPIAVSLVKVARLVRDLGPGEEVRGVGVGVGVGAVEHVVHAVETRQR